MLFLVLEMETILLIVIGLISTLALIFMILFIFSCLHPRQKHIINQDKDEQHELNVIHEPEDTFDEYYIDQT